MLNGLQTSICETTEGIKGYSGHVNLPANPAANRNYPAHMYFWFFQARENHETAPLSLWFSGGPGVPSTSAALGEHGPCSVIEDSKTTELNPWSWNEKANMVYIDQPVQVGYSFDFLVNGTLDEVASPFQYRPANFSQTGIPETNLTFLTGTFPSASFANSPNTTLNAAPFIWEFMQAWMQEYVMCSGAHVLRGAADSSIDFRGISLPTIDSAFGLSHMADITVRFMRTISSSRMTKSQTAALQDLLFHSMSTLSVLLTHALISMYRWTFTRSTPITIPTAKSSSLRRLMRLRSLHPPRVRI